LSNGSNEVSKNAGDTARFNYGKRYKKNSGSKDVPVTRLIEKMITAHKGTLRVCWGFNKNEKRSFF
jgi:hypothetical protein